MLCVEYLGVLCVCAVCVRFVCALCVCAFIVRFMCALCVCALCVHFVCALCVCVFHVCVGVGVGRGEITYHLPSVSESLGYRDTRSAEQLEVHLCY